MRVIVHIGFGKTGTTSIQNDILPILEKSGLIVLVDSQKIKSDLQNYLLFDIMPKPLVFENSNSTYFISLEGLIGWGPHSWNKCLEFNKLYFPKTSEIVITFKSHLDYLRSFYLQMLQQGESDLTPQNFFLKDADFKKMKNIYGNLIYLYPRIFNIDELNYNLIANQYKVNFRKVYLIDFDSVINKSFINLIFETNDLPYIKLKKYNKSYSQLSVKFDRSRHIFLNKFNLTNNSSSVQLLKLKVPKIEKKIAVKKSIMQYLKYPFFPLYIIFLFFFNHRHFLQTVINPLNKKKFILIIKIQFSYRFRDITN